MPRGDEVRPAPTPSVKFTYEDLLNFPDDGTRHEIIDGERFVTPLPTRKHQEVAGRLHLRLGNYLEAHPVGAIYFAPFDVVFSNLDTIKVYRHIDGAFARVAELSAERGDTVTTPLFPGLSIRLTDIFKPPLQG